MFALLIFLLPIIFSGILILRKTTSLNRIELILPAGSTLGLVIFTFLLNSISFLIKGHTGIVTAYLSTVFFGLLIIKLVKVKNEQINFLSGRQLVFWILSIIIWGGFIFWKTAHALIGSDTNLYYGITHSFIKGNFPFLTPWQPDIPLSYHIGASELLGAFYFFSGLDFQFLHLFFSALFIFCAAQIIIWIIRRHHSLVGFLLSNLVAAVTFISFGFIYITWPVFPLHLPVIRNVNQLMFWLRDLPTVSPAIEVYGAPINLDALIYFIFHAFGLAIFFSLLVLALNYKKEKQWIGWIIISIGLSGLALVNESLFVATFPAIFFGIFLIELRQKSLIKNLKKLLFLILATILVVLFQGGTISASINSPPNLEKSTLIFPKKEDIKEDFKGYHLGQESSKLLPEKSEWLPLRWFHPGADSLLLFSLIAILIIRSDFYHLVLLRVLFVVGFTSLVAYNVVVPKFLVANGNRFLSASFLFFSLLLCLSAVLVFEKIKKSPVKKTLFLIMIGWIFIPTILPPLALFSKTRFGENKLIPRYKQSSEGVLWLKNNVNYNEKVIVLDKNAPHPSGQARALVESGVFAPVFHGNFRAFTIEASPEYIDIAYFLSPEALNKLKINILLIDNDFFETLPEKRKKQLEDSYYFEKIFDDSSYSSDWERIYKVNDKYLEYGEELDGTFVQFQAVLLAQGKIYIDNEENFNPSFLRRPVIFSLRDRDIYYLPQSGVYLNVETNINSHHPLESEDYDYLVLGKSTDPKSICNCQAKVIWTGLKGEVFVWQRLMIKIQETKKYFDKQ